MYNLTVEVEDIARDLKDTAVAFRGLRPERLWDELAVIRAAQRRLTVLLATTLMVAVLVAVAAVVASIG